MAHSSTYSPRGFSLQSLAQDRKAEQQALLTDENIIIRKGIWLYFLLLLFEGALRKWVFPGLATPLLVVRDPIALWLVLMAWYRGLLPANVYMAGTVMIGFIGLFTATLLGHGNIQVAIYGMRILVFHFPLMFVIGRIFIRADVLQVGRVTLYIAIPMAILVAMQFYSPQSAWVNIGVGGDTEGAGFAGAMGYFRPPGTFSFTTGNVQFFGLVAPFVLYFWLNPKEINKLVLVGATAALLAAVPLSISRSLFFQVGVAVMFAVLAVSRNAKYARQMMLTGVIGIVALAVLSHTSFFQTATEAFFERFDTANEVEGGLDGVLIDRYFGGMMGALTQSGDLPFFGMGIGMGTNAGSMLMTGGVEYLISEGEWGRLIGEMGPLLGIALIVLRLAFCAKISVAAYAKVRHGDLLPWMVLSFALLVIPQGQWAQPTALGFSTLLGGLVIASLREPGHP